VIVAGYPGRFKDLESTIAWARRIAASGMIAVTYSNREPLADLRALLDDVRSGAGLRHASGQCIDPSRLALWASSGNVPLALSALRGMRCAALLYGFMLDLDEASTNFGFVKPQTRFEDIPADVPLFIARAGRDQFSGLNDTIDRFVAASLARNLPITLVNHAEAPHAFDLVDEGETSREIVRQILRFLRFHLVDKFAALSTSSSARS